MSLLNTNVSNNKLTIKMCSKIDSNNIDKIQNEINAILDSSTVLSVTINAEDLEYISSIGLRAMLSLKKRINDFKIINVSDEVYDIFDMTRFTDIMNVSKVYRNLSINNCAVLGKGACGTVYKLSDETIVKVFVSGYELEKIEKERENSRNAFKNGINTAIPFDIVKVGENYGLVYEIVNAETLKDLMLKDCSKLTYLIEIYADSVKNMHNIIFDKECYPDMKTVWTEKINNLNGVLNNDEKAAALKIISIIPDRKNFNHGDMNLSNLMIENGKAVVIDIEDAVLGHPIFDVSFIYYLLKLLPELLPSDMCKLIQGFSKEENQLMWCRFCEIYFGCNNSEERALYEKNIHPYGIIKLMELIPFYYAVFDSADDENKKYLPALYVAFNTAVEKYKRELVETAEKENNTFLF